MDSSTDESFKDRLRLIVSATGFRGPADRRLIPFWIHDLEFSSPWLEAGLSVPWVVSYPCLACAPFGKVQFLCVRTFFVLLALTLPSAAIAFERDYAPDLELSPTEEGRILELAKQKGLASVTCIRTYLIQMSDGHVGISVDGPRIQSGYKVRTRYMHLTSGARAAYDLKHGKLVDDNLLKEARVVQDEQDVFKLGEKEYLVRLEGEITRADAEKVLRLLVAGRVRYGSGVAAEDLKGFYVHRPRAIGLYNGDFTASIESSSESSGCLIYFTLKDGAVLISKIFVTVV